VEKNHTIVTFPVKNLQLGDHIPVPKDKDGNPVPSKYNLAGGLSRASTRPTFLSTNRVRPLYEHSPGWYVMLRSRCKCLFSIIPLP
jgi:hypothetical protein